MPVLPSYRNQSIEQFLKITPYDKHQNFEDIIKIYFEDIYN